MTEGAGKGRGTRAAGLVALAAAVLLVLQSLASFGAAARAHGAGGPGATAQAACAASPSDRSHRPERNDCALCCIVCAARDHAQAFPFVAPSRDEGTPAPRAMLIGARAFADRARRPAIPTGSCSARAPPLS